MAPSVGLNFRDGGVNFGRHTKPPWGGGLYLCIFREGFIIFREGFNQKFPSGLTSHPGGACRCTAPSLGRPAPWRSATTAGERRWHGWSLCDGIQMCANAWVGFSARGGVQLSAFGFPRNRLPFFDWPVSEEPGSHTSSVVIKPCLFPQWMTGGCHHCCFFFLPVVA